jgi:hypothetical protein
MSTLNKEELKKVYINILKKAAKKSGTNMEAALLSIKQELINNVWASRRCKVEPTPGCCGVRQIANVETSVVNTILTKLLCQSSVPQQMMYKFYTNKPKETAAFVKIGFEKTNRFYNSNSGHQVDELTFVTSPTDSFKWPTMYDMKAVLGAEVVMRELSTQTEARTVSRAKPSAPRKT